MFATLRENREKVVFVDWHEGMDGYALLDMLNIKAEKVAIFLINGEKSEPDKKLNADDIISLFPPIGGG